MVRNIVSGVSLVMIVPMISPLVTGLVGVLIHVHVYTLYSSWPPTSHSAAEIHIGILIVTHAHDAPKVTAQLFTSPSNFNNTCLILLDLLVPHCEYAR